MKIRTITAFTPLTWPLDKGSLASAARFLTDARLRFNEAGIEVQSICLATPPFLDVLSYPDADLLLEFALILEDLANNYAIDAISVGPVVATTPHALLMSIYALPQLINKTDKVFSSILFADEYSGANLAAVHAFAKIVHEVAHATPDGLGNLRLGALANVPPNVPLPHAAYHQGGSSYFIIATEAADLALTAVDSTRSTQQAHERLVTSIEDATAELLGVVDNLVDDHHIRFKGIDFSLAPYPDQARSIGSAIEGLGIDVFGGSGTLIAIAFLANAIQKANIPRTGLSGVMLPVLGDTTVARRAEEGHVSVNDLLLYSAICNAGLDIIPVPGDTTSDELGAILLDMAALAIMVGRPMSARLMPMPGLFAGDKISFEADNLASGRVLSLKNLGAQKLFEKNSFLTLSPLMQRRRTRSEVLPTSSRFI